ncbi:MAG: diversity-generating retroelement protein Avd [Nitrospinae bacterium]|nr:diversity-generating retroelement protein Avd [Nitrospinota bacterium]
MSDKEDALTKTYDLMVWLFPQIGRFPREHRYTLGSRLENSLLDICGNLIEARYSREKTVLLHATNILLEKLRYLARLSKDLRFISVKKYEYLSREINMIGMFVGGWLKKVKEMSS